MSCLGGAHEPGGLQVGHRHRLGTVHNHIHMAHHTQPTVTLLHGLAFALRFLDDVGDRTVDHAVVVLFDCLPAIKGRGKYLYLMFLNIFKVMYHVFS